MKVEDVLTVHDYETSRTSVEFQAWWDARYAEYGKTRKGVIFCRESKGLSKKFFEEAHPMRTFMESYYPGSPLRCRLSARDDKADAVLLDESGTVVRQIQVTFAVDGRTEHLRSQELTRFGHVDALGKPEETGRGRNRTVTFPTTGFTLHQNIVDEVLSRVRERIESKSSMAYGAEFVLVVGFSDRSLNPEDVDQFTRFRAQVSHAFAEVYLVGVHGRILVPPANR
jgi:hypothetical protein